MPCPMQAASVLHWVPHSSVNLCLVASPGMTAIQYGVCMFCVCTGMLAHRKCSASMGARCCCRMAVIHELHNRPACSLPALPCLMHIPFCPALLSAGVVLSSRPALLLHVLPPLLPSNAAMVWCCLCPYPAGVLGCLTAAGCPTSLRRLQQSWPSMMWCCCWMSSGPWLTLATSKLRLYCHRVARVGEGLTLPSKAHRLLAGCIRDN